jgi:hypothetical protein
MTENINGKNFESSLIAKAWKDEAFKQELIRNPKTVIERELGKKLPESLHIKVLEEDVNTVYLVLPAAMQVTEQLSEEALEAFAGGGFIFIFHGRNAPYIIFTEI